MQEQGSTYSGKSLTPEQREMARRLWEICTKGTGPEDLAVGREAMREAPDEVRCAVLTAYSAIWSQGRNPQFGENPFE